MNLWIQRHDFTSEEKSDATLELAMKALLEFNWLEELEKRLPLKGGACDPGLGLVAEDDSILHICPQSKDDCYVHYHYSVDKKILGFIPTKSPETYHIKKCSISTAQDLIRFHFEGKRGAILEIQ